LAVYCFFISQISPHYLGIIVWLL